jgi:hypothetical protein
LSGSLPESVALELREHLAGCPACSAELDSTERVWHQLGDLEAASPDTEAMRGRLLAMLEGYEHGHDAGRVARIAPARGFTIGAWAQRLAQVAAGALLLLTGALLGRAIESPPEPGSATSALRAELHEVRQMLTLSLLQQQWATERLRGVTATAQLDDPGNEVVAALLDALTHDPNVNVRLAVVDALGRLGDRQIVRARSVEALDTVESPLLQVALIDLLVTIRERRSIEVLQRLAADGSVDDAVRARATEGIQQLGAQS